MWDYPPPSPASRPLATGFQTPVTCGLSFTCTLSFPLVWGLIWLSITTWTSVFSFTYICLATCFKTQLSRKRWVLTITLPCIHPYYSHCCPRSVGAIEKLGLSLTNTECVVCININSEGCSSLTPGSRWWGCPDSSCLAGLGCDKTLTLLLCSLKSQELSASTWPEYIWKVLSGDSLDIAFQLASFLPHFSLLRTRP